MGHVRNKIRKPYPACQSSVIFLLLVFPLTMVVAAPINYDGWTVVNGVIDAPCPVEAQSCEDPILDDGFLVRKITMPAVVLAWTTGDLFEQSGPKSYYQYIMTDPGATGDPTSLAFDVDGLRFANETISKASSTVAGHTSQKITIAESLMSVDNIETRWSQIATTEAGGRQSSLDAILVSGNMTSIIEQEIRQIDWTSPADPFELMYSRSKLIGSDGVNGVKFSDMVIDQDINLGVGGKQGFEWLRDEHTSTSHTIGDGPAVLPGGSNGGDFNIYSVGGVINQLTATWVGQILADATGTGGTASFSYTGYDHYGTDNTGLNSYHDVTELTSFDAANPPTLINTYFASTSQYPNFFDVNSDINALPALITPTAWLNLTPDYVSARNDHVTNPLTGTGGGGPPIDLGSWTVDNGVISVDACLAGLTCGEALTGAGFYQRQVIDSLGNTYFQTIITEGGATGDPKVAPIYTPSGSSGSFNIGALGYANETFVSPGRSGLSNKTQFLGTAPILSEATPGIFQFNFVPEVKQTTPMAYKTKINTGWAEGIGATPVLEIKQVLAFETNPGLPAIVSGDAPSFLGRSTGIQFDLTMASNGARDYSLVSVSSPAPNRPEVLYMRQIDGGVQNTSHAITDPFLIPDGTNGGNIEWAAGDSLSAMWSWANYNLYGPNAPTVNIGTVAYANLTTGARTSLGSTAMYNPPAAWVDPFATPAPPSSVGGVIAWPAQDTTW
jgi:hypothetical protein